jgi:hypothetical protein
MAREILPGGCTDPLGGRFFELLERRVGTMRLIVISVALASSLSLLILARAG